MKIKFEKLNIELILPQTPKQINLSTMSCCNTTFTLILKTKHTIDTPTSTIAQTKNLKLKSDSIQKNKSWTDASQIIESFNTTAWASVNLIVCGFLPSEKRRQVQSGGHLADDDVDPVSSMGFVTHPWWWRLRHRRRSPDVVVGFFALKFGCFAYVWVGWGMRSLSWTTSYDGFLV